MRLDKTERCVSTRVRDAAHMRLLADSKQTLAGALHEVWVGRFDLKQLVSKTCHNADFAHSF